MSVKRLVDDLANISDRTLLRQLVVMAAVRGGPDVLRLVAVEAQREAMARNLRAMLHSARRRGDEPDVARCEAALARLEGKR